MFEIVKAVIKKYIYIYSYMITIEQQYFLINKVSKCCNIFHILMEFLICDLIFLFLFILFIQTLSGSKNLAGLVCSLFHFLASFGSFMVWFGLSLVFFGLLVAFFFFIVKNGGFFFFVCIF